MDPRILMGRAPIVTGMLIAAIGVAILFADRIPLLGRLPGDINIHGKNWSVHVPIVSALVISLILTVILNLFFRR